MEAIFSITFNGVIGINMLHAVSDNFFMKKAIEQAQLAFEADEVPVGAVIVSNQQIIARGRNTTEQFKDVTAHAEMVAITAASHFLGAKYLTECTLYVTLEPCVMCAGALAWSQIGRIVFGASDEKRGFLRVGKQLLHPKTKLEYGVEEEACRELLKSFFRNKR